MGNWRIWMTESELKLRQETLIILLEKFGSSNDNRIRTIYECADDWCCKFKTTSGLVKYYETYYNKTK